MIAVHRGAGMLVPIFGILSALIGNILTGKFFDSSYYQEHDWPKMLVLVSAGLACLIMGIWLKRKRQRDFLREQAYVESFKPGPMNDLAFAGPRDHLMFIPLQYWSIPYFLAAVIYGLSTL